MWKGVLIVSGGMLLATPAVAADLARDLGPPDQETAFAPTQLPVLPVLTGGYVGLHTGWSWAQKDWVGPSNPAPAPGFSNANVADHDPNGVIGGFTAGYRGQWQSVLVGIEGEATWVDLSETTPSTAYADFYKRTEVDWIATITGQVGAQYGRFFPYVEAGVGFAHDKYTIIDMDGPDDEGGSTSDTRVGFVIGLGVEAAITDMLSAKAEYNYMHFGEDDYTIAGEDWDIEQSMHVFRLGMNLRFATY